MDIEQLVAKLAAQTRECGTCGGYGHRFRPVSPGSIDNERFACPDCHGSGEVPLIERLRRQPSNDTNVIPKQGWLPVSPQEAGWVLMDYWLQEKGIYVWVDLHQKQDNYREKEFVAQMDAWYGYGETPWEAVIRAAAKAMLGMEVV